MADLTVAPVSTGRTTSTLERVDRAWSALALRRRRLAVAGGVSAVAISLATTTVIDVVPALAIAAVGLLAGAAAIVDQHERLLPNTLLTIALLIVGVAAVIEGPWTVVDASVSLTMAAFPLWAVRYGKGLAIGDVKFTAVLGAGVGLVHPFAGLAVVWCAALASGVFALATRRSRLALGPWLWAGYVAAAAMAVVFVQVLEMGGRTWPVRP